MARVVPPPSRLVVAHEGGRVRIAAKVRRNWFVVLFLGAWLGGWATGEAFAIGQLVAGGARGGVSAFLAFWLAGWTVGGAWATHAFLLNLIGREVITLDERTLSVRLEAAGIGRSREYDLASVTNPRAEPARFDLFNGGRTSPWRSGAISFDYGAKTFRLGISLEGQDVQTVLEAIRERLPATARSGW